MQKSHLEINLHEAINDPSKADEVVKAVQATIDELTIAATQALDTAKAANKNADEFQKQVELLTESTKNLADAIKNIHLKLNQYADIVDKSDELAELRKELAIFVTNSGMIKLGAMSNDATK